MKKYSIGIIAAVIAIVGSAFTNANNKSLVQMKTENNAWFVYDDNNDDIATENEAMVQTNYRPAEPEDLEGCTEETHLCAIYAEDESGLPKIASQPIASTISDFFDSEPVSEEELLAKE